MACAEAEVFVAGDQNRRDACIWGYGYLFEFLGRAVKTADMPNQLVERHLCPKADLTRVGAAGRV